jgi:demethylmenaquinone methyltransferase/2-methoxy-6-polyprenyl-1,4-benzoquinol methylase
MIVSRVVNTVTGSPINDSSIPHKPSDTAYVRSMFDSIAPTYDFLNTLLSGGMHKVWERKTVMSVPADLGGACLDLCTGTGALVPRLSKRFQFVCAADISPAMLDIGRRKHARLTNVEWVEANAQQLPFADNRFSAVTVAYGVRNLPEPDRGLREVWRVTKSGGHLAVLEFGRPQNPIWRALFDVYSKAVIPTLGALVSGNRTAYRYLPKTSAAFPCGSAFEQMLREAGWTPLSSTALCGGVAFVYQAVKQ